MTKSQQVLVDLLRKSLFNAVIEIPKNVNWQEVYDEANFQSVVPMAFDGTAGIEGIPVDIYKKFKNHTVAVMLNNDNILKAQNELCRLLEKEKIDYAILKGLSVARCYPNPDLRTLGDVDFLVNKGEFDDVKELLVRNGYALVMEELNHFHCALKKDDVTFELHFEMTDFPKSDLCDELRTVLDKAMENTNIIECMGNKFSSLDDLFQAVSLLLHTERHISKDGIGLRQLLDFALFIKSNPSVLEENQNVEFLKNYGLYKLAMVCVDLFNKYFCVDEVNNPTADILFELALKKGNFGVKRELEDTYTNGSVRIVEKNSIKKYYKFFENRAELTWSLAKRYPFLKHFGFIYLPIRHVFRLVLGKKTNIKYRKVFAAVNELNEFYSDLSIFRR